MLERTLEAFEGAYIYRGKIIDHPDDHQISGPRNQGGRGLIGGRAALARRSFNRRRRVRREVADIEHGPQQRR